MTHTHTHTHIHPPPPHIHTHSILLQLWNVTVSTLHQSLADIPKKSRKTYLYERMYSALNVLRDFFFAGGNGLGAGDLESKDYTVQKSFNTLGCCQERIWFAVQRGGMKGALLPLPSEPSVSNLLRACAGSLPFPRGCQFHGGANFTGMPFLRGCQFHGGANFTGVPISRGCQFHGDTNFMAVPISRGVLISLYHTHTHTLSLTHTYTHSLSHTHTPLSISLSLSHPHTHTHTHTGTLWSLGPSPSTRNPRPPDA